MSHGNYRTLHYREAIKIAERKELILVTTDDVLIVNQGSKSAEAIHIVAEPNFWEHDEPKGFGVELVRPHWLYGSEGHLFPLRWIGRVDDLTSAELDAMTDDDPYLELIPEHGSFLWALPKFRHGDNPQAWQRCELSWWEAFRTSDGDK